MKIFNVPSTEHITFGFRHIRFFKHRIIHVQSRRPMRVTHGRRRRGTVGDDASSRGPSLVKRRARCRLAYTHRDPGEGTPVKFPRVGEREKRRGPRRADRVVGSRARLESTRLARATRKRDTAVPPCRRPRAVSPRARLVRTAAAARRPIARATLVRACGARDVPRERVPETARGGRA